MATTTLSTERWIESNSPTTSLRTDLWSFTLTPFNTSTLATDLWNFDDSVGILPTHNTSLVSSVARVQQNTPFPQFVMGGRNLGSYALFKKSTAYTFQVWRSPVHKIGTDFDILSITFPLITDLAAGTSIVPKLYFDSERETAVGTTINLNNYSNDNKLITLTSKNFNNELHGQSNFFLEFQFLGSVEAVIGLPIHIELEVEDIT